MEKKQQFEEERGGKKSPEAQKTIRKIEENNNTKNISLE